MTVPSRSVPIVEEHWSRSTLASEVSTAIAVDGFLDHVESLFVALSQRPWRTEQLERFARLLHGAEQECLGRVDRAMRHGREVA